MKESCNFEVARLVTFRFGTFAMLFAPLCVFFIMKILEDEW